MIEPAQAVELMTPRARAVAARQLELAKRRCAAAASRKTNAPPSAQEETR